MTSPLLAVDSLSVAFRTTGFGSSEVLHKISFDIQPGERLALVGESGSGKSVTALAILRLHDPAITAYPSGRILFEERDLLQLPDRKIRAVRGREIAMIFQEPMTSLNPVYPIGKQLVEPLLLHEGVSQATARKRMIELLDRTGIVEPHKRFDAFPHMLSGGQRQRVMIAMALACSPKLLIADEPTTALDVTVQAQILELLADLQREFSMAVLLITHDLPLVRYFAERVCVMRRGELVEKGPVTRVFEEPQHAYTRHLLNSQPRRMVSDEASRALQGGPRLLTASQLRCYFPVKAGFFRHKIGEIRAVDDVDRVRRSVSSANRARASRRSDCASCACRTARGRSVLTVGALISSARVSCARCGVISRLFSRTLTHRSHRA
jgi:microcin C transport system ATP-binding protein